jgi:ABC-type glycerol-3-phosphate transport system permease component
MVSTSLKTDLQVMNSSGFANAFLPNPVRWKNYADALSYVNLVRYFGNTFFVTVASIIGTILSCSLVAFSFSRLRWPGRDAVFVILLATMMLPSQVTMIPVFLIFQKLGWVNTLRPLWVPSFFGTAFYIFLMRQAFLSIPNDLEDAAKIDGCGYFRIYWKVMLPLIKPAIAAVAIFQFIWSWNDFLGPLIYIHDKDLMTLSLGLQLFQNQHGAEWGMLMAASTMMTIPILVIFFVAQRYFIRGVVLTGLKG